MWVNAMMTIWLWGTILSFVLIGISLWLWYLPHTYREDAHKDNHKGNDTGDG